MIIVFFFLSFLSYKLRSSGGVKIVIFIVYICNPYSEVPEKPEMPITLSVYIC